MLDAVEFLKERLRMCETYSESFLCGRGCPMPFRPCEFHSFTEGHFEQMVETVEQWSKEHPIITNGMKFEEVFGIKPTDPNGNFLCPPTVSTCDPGGCKECCVWWDKPFVDPDEEA